MSVDLPNVEVNFGSVTPSADDILEAFVHCGCTKEVSSFNVLLQNWDKKFSPGETDEIAVADATTIKLGRGSNKPLLLTGRVESIKPFSTPLAHYIRLEGRCVGEKLFRRLITENYYSQKGEAIVLDVISNYTDLAYTIGSTDTTFAKLEYEDTVLFDILTMICETATKSGVVGFDQRIDPDGEYNFFERGSKTSSVTLTDMMEVGNYKKDIFRVKNKITVYGAQERTEPTDLDAGWCESLTGWTALSGVLSLISAPPAYVRKGTYSIECRDAAGNTASFYRSVSDAIRRYKKFVFWCQPAAIAVSSKYLRLLAPDTSNYFQADIPNFNSTVWNFNEYNIGKEYEYDVDNNPNGVWTPVGSPNWLNIKGAWFVFNSLSSPTWLLIDGDTGFTFGRWRNTQEDATSQSNYGLRELVTVDEELHSDAECQLRAEALVDWKKDPFEYLTLRSTVLDYGTTPILAGDKITAVLPNENINSDYRVISAEYHFIAAQQELEVSLELGKEKSMLADRIYLMRKRIGEVLRYKQGVATGRD